MADPLQVDTDLVRPPGQGKAFDDGVAAGGDGGVWVVG